MYVPVIGLEIHVQLSTNTKMFCSSKNDPDEEKPNVNVCPICLAHPGTLPVPNKKAIEYTIQAGLALEADIASFSRFDRKNYFYPDLPKGYQISQYKHPLCRGGELLLPNNKVVRLRRIHLEEDTGKLLHPEGADYSLIDFNRAGIPLMELVTEPDINSAAEARLFCEELQLILRYLGIAKANMQKGEMRCEVNISLVPQADSLKHKLSGTKVEIKNLNSFRSVERAIDYEIKRQTKILKRGLSVIQETRGWDETNEKTVPQRSKEEAHDYRYFPEPDIPPLIIYKTSEQAEKNKEKDKVTEPLIIQEYQERLGELPAQRRARFARQYQLTSEQIEILVRNKSLGEYYEKSISELMAWFKAEGGKLKQTTFEKLNSLAANFITVNLIPLMVEEKLAVVELKMTPENYAELIKMIVRGDLSSSAAKTILQHMVKKGGDPSDIARQLNLIQESDTSAIIAIIETVIKDSPSAVEDFKKGNLNAIQFLVGKVMQKTKGKANPRITSELLKKRLRK